MAFEEVQLATMPGGSKQREDVSALLDTDGDDENLDEFGRSSRQNSEADTTSYGFFAKGRDFEGVNTNHVFSKEDWKTMEKFESMQYIPSNSVVYRQWLSKQNHHTGWDRWIAFGAIGICVGLISFMLRQCIGGLSVIRAQYMMHLLDRFNHEGAAYAWFMGFGVLLAGLSTCIIVFVTPAASGSGIPEVIAFLNGVKIPKIFNFRTLVSKFVSCALAVGSGMPVGPEGPMIHMGAMTGAGVSQGRSKTLGFEMKLFERFRTSKDRRDFISGGAACGVAAAFGAPIGGVLFAMEEVASFWEATLTWPIFFATMCSVFFADMLGSAVSNFQFQLTSSNQFGTFDDAVSILFQISTRLRMHIGAIPVALIVGVFGGAMGAMFTFLNLKVNRFRKAVVSKVPLFRVVEVILIAFITFTWAFWTPFGFGCQERPSCDVLISSGATTEEECSDYLEENFMKFNCKEEEWNPAATLLVRPGDDAIKSLFIRNAPTLFDYGPIFALLVPYFFLACWAAGCAVSSGLVVPMLLIGSAMGRFVGLVLHDAFPDRELDDITRQWMDPGVWSLIGAASFFGGVSRLTVSLVVIMVEISNDVHFLVPIMLTVMTAKRTADFATHGLYHALLELKCVPFVDLMTHFHSDPELYMVRDVMRSNPVCVRLAPTVQQICDVLSSTTHNSFPVVKVMDGKHRMVGSIARPMLLSLLGHPQAWFDEEGRATNKSRLLEYNDVMKCGGAEGIVPQSLTKQVVGSLPAENMNHTIQLHPYINTSAFEVQQTLSLRQAFVLFRTLGLRHLFVVDEQHCPVGVITRKDLNGLKMEGRMHDADWAARDREIISIIGNSDEGNSRKSHAREVDM